MGRGPSANAPAGAAGGRPAKPSVAELGIDLDAPTSPPAPVWRRSGAGGGAGGGADDSAGDGAIEVAFVEARGEMWVLMRVAGDPAGRVLVYDRHEWECFLDGAKNGEFDDAAACSGPAAESAADARPPSADSV